MTIFLILGGLGAALLLFSLLVGDLLDQVTGLNALDNDFLSIAGVAGFVGALGFAGAITLSLVGSTPLAIVVGVLAGSAVGAGAAWLTVKLKDDSSSSDATVRPAALIGATGRVIHTIPEGGYGQIRVSVNGHPTKLNARAAESIQSGRLVEITEIISPTAVYVRYGEPLEP